MTQREIAAYEARILEEIQALQPVEHRDQPVPTHPNAIKEKAIRRRGGHKLRTELWRFAGVDLTRIDGIGTEAALTLLTEAGLDLTAFFREALCVLAAPGSKNGLFRRQAAPPQEVQRHRLHPGRRRPADGGRLSEALQDRSRRRLSSQGPPQGMECRRRSSPWPAG